MDENAHTGFGESYAIVADALSNKGSTQTGKLVFKATKYRNAK